MSFTIEIRSDRESDNESTIIGRFSDCAWNSLWRELSVSRKHWEEWQASQANVPLLPDFPEISKLAYIDEEVVHFRPTELNDECIKMMPIVSSDAT